jgi:hypothetical protein
LTEQSIPLLSNLTETNDLIFQKCTTLPVPDQEPTPRLETEPDEFRALTAFQSVGCSEVKYFFVNDLTERIESQYTHTTIGEFATELTELISDADRGGVSFVVRVEGDGLTEAGKLQIDDCDEAATSLLSPFAFAIIETSDKNYQCWLAFHDEEDKEAARDRLFEYLRDRAPSANPGSGGAVRWPGSINFKPERNGWRVRVHSMNLGRYTTPSELDDAGLLADPLPATDWNSIPDSACADDWPDWQSCLRYKTKEAEEKKLRRDSHRSEADASFVCRAILNGHSDAAIQAKLLEVSPRAQEKLAKSQKTGEKYAAHTIAKVKRWIELRRNQN